MIRISDDYAKHLSRELGVSYESVERADANYMTCFKIRKSVKIPLNIKYETEVRKIAEKYNLSLKQAVHHLEVFGILEDKAVLDKLLEK